ncbi:MFS transporter [Streptomyces sp. NBC_00683]|uniref:MFS transporter n=1 Tax=Streptomyces sp. NBC_00683 TaxID=2903670 RepID=UPI002E2F9382|nr:MFS transporter [Streptomyces sp. NBC_00683]
MPRAGTLPAVLTGLFVTVLDFFIVNVAVPTAQRDLHADAAAVEWVVAGYALAYGSMLIVGGRLGDIHGRRRMFSVGMVFFTLASIACGLAPGPGALVAARIAQGVSAALLAPQVLAIVRTVYTGHERARAINAYALTMGSAAVFGQLIGGALIHADVFGLGWRACFLINVPIGIAVLAVARRVIPESRATGAVRLDLPGAALVSLSLVALMLPLIEGREQRWPLWTWASFAGSVALAGAYRARRHRESPLIDLALLRERGFTVGLFTYTAFTMGMAAYFLVLALYAQEGRGLDAMEAGLLFVPIGAGYLAASLLAPRLMLRLGRQVIAVGALVRVAGLALLFVMVAQDAAIGWLASALLVDGVGMGLALAPIMATVLAGIPPHHAGAASGALNTVQQVGGALGVGVIGILYYGSLAEGSSTAFLHGLTYLIAVALVLAGLAQLLPRAASVPSASSHASGASREGVQS